MLLLSGRPGQTRAIYRARHVSKDIPSDYDINLRLPYVLALFMKLRRCFLELQPRRNVAPLHAWSPCPSVIPRGRLPSPLVASANPIYAPNILRNLAAIAITNQAAITSGHQAAPGLRSPSSSPSDSFTCAGAHSSVLQSIRLDTSCSNMSDTDDEASLSQFGYLTPPLSPTKTISTEGWASPRTPQSPRKSRSCLFFRDIDSGLTSHCPTPSSSPRKSRFLSRAASPSLIPTDTVITFESPSLPHLHCIDISADDSSPTTKLRRLPLRYSSSPLRSIQWLARGGLLASPSQTQTSTPDRFIACRRPPALTRESFELNSPSERRNKEQNTNRGTRTGADAFSRRLRRSGRLNEELRGLREAHSVVSGRANATRRNVNFRRSPLPLGARQISAGAVWNVGGPSAVSDTVVAVSTGRGRMLGSGTNAPLYKSAFLNRADPDAELEAYERRLALALDIDQTDRILQHSSSPVSVSSPHGGPASQAKHVWRDGAWVKDGVNSSLFSFRANFKFCVAANLR